ncbi:MAG: class I SAM-dependent methyltransferase [Desulfobacterota bacterium]|nr:class I SAM-dependent methyltransferase [Thermodesulfobacteriota bacterium]
MEGLFSHEDIRKTYEELAWHRRSKDIIQEYALNLKDIRDVALEGIDATKAAAVLDLGCGYGFFTEKLTGRLRPGAKIIGIDVVNHSNRQTFLDTVTLMGYSAAFIQGSADMIRDMADASFDLVIASYSLYFFPHLIPQIARVLRSSGIFIVVTHSRYSLQELTSFVPFSMKTAGLQMPEDLRINMLFRSFSLEDGGLQLDPYFRDVERIPYENSLVFPLDRFDACIDYLDTKKHLLLKEVNDVHPGKFDVVLAVLVKTLFDHARAHGKVLITKDDGIFRCRFPVHGRRVA